MTQTPQTQHSVEAEHWSRLQESGTVLGMRFLLWIYKLFGRFIFRLFLYPVMLFYMIRRGSARRASQDFLDKHYQTYPQAWNQKPGLWHTLRHFLSFGDAILDKLLAWSAHLSEDEFELLNPELTETLLGDQRGQLIIGTHLGNLEYCRGFMQRYMSKDINVLVYDQHAAHFVKMMQQINATSRVNVYQVDQLDLKTILLLKTKIDQGEWLFIAGDRVPVTLARDVSKQSDAKLEQKNTAKVDFLGHPAAFPIGPYMLANSLACPVKLMFSYRDKDIVKFDVVSFNQDDPIQLKRAQRQQQLQGFAQDFASQLERHCATVPYQWFNFYDFWNQA